MPSDDLFSAEQRSTAIRHVWDDGLAPSTSPFSHVVLCDGVAYVSGILGQDPTTGRLVGPDMTTQATQAFDNLTLLLERGRMPLRDVLRTTIYIVDYAEFEQLNAVYRCAFDAPYPARATAAVAALPFGARIQVDAIVRAPRTFPSPSSKQQKEH